MAAEGLNTIKVKVINLKRGPDNSEDDYIHLLSFALFLSTLKIRNIVKNTIRVKVSKLKCGTDAFKGEYMQLFSSILFFWTWSTPFFPESGQLSSLGWF